MVRRVVGLPLRIWRWTLFGLWDLVALNAIVFNMALVLFNESEWRWLNLLAVMLLCVTTTNLRATRKWIKRLDKEADEWSAICDQYKDVTERLIQSREPQPFFRTPRRDSTTRTPPIVH